MMKTKPNHILNFWFADRVAAQWFNASCELDKEILKKFEPTWQQAMAGDLDHWMQKADSCLALVITLDQLPLHMYRGTEKSFSTNKKAVEVAWHAVKNNLDINLNSQELTFLYMPFMHSEELTEQDLAISLLREKQLSQALKYAERYREIIRKFGRFPQRNKILGRKSSKEEIAYLTSTHVLEK